MARPAKSKTGRTARRSPGWGDRGRGWISALATVALAGSVLWIWWAGREGSESGEGWGQEIPVPAEERDALPDWVTQAVPWLEEVGGGSGTGRTSAVEVPAEPVPEPVRREVPSVAAGAGTTNEPTEAAPVPAPLPRTVEVPGRDRVIFAQVALARRGISSGSVDGVVGSQTRAALRVFQREAGLRETGELDAMTWAALGGGVGERVGNVFTIYTVTANDLERLKPVPGTWLGKSQQDRLDYETVVELVAEKFHAHPRLVRALNPGVDWGRVRPGTELRVPEVGLPKVSGRVAHVRIRLRDKTLQAFDERSRRVLHFPCSIARRVEKRPLGTLRVVHVAPNPNYRFDPAIFRDSEEARRIGRRLMIPPGPNNPVGTAWIGLDRPGYGIHGTPHPEDVGRTESSGCFRLANWNAELLLPLVWVGMPVYVEP